MIAPIPPKLIDWMQTQHISPSQRWIPCFIPPASDSSCICSSSELSSDTCDPQAKLRPMDELPLDLPHLPHLSSSGGSPSPERRSHSPGSDDALEDYPLLQASSNNKDVRVELSILLGPSASAAPMPPQINDSSDYTAYGIHKFLSFRDEHIDEPVANWIVNRNPLHPTKSLHENEMYMPAFRAATGLDDAVHDCGGCHMTKLFFRAVVPELDWSIEVHSRATVLEVLQAINNALLRPDSDLEKTLNSLPETTRRCWMMVNTNSWYRHKRIGTDNQNPLSSNTFLFIDRLNLNHHEVEHFWGIEAELSGEQWVVRAGRGASRATRKCHCSMSRCAQECSLDVCTPSTYAVRGRFTPGGLACRCASY